MFEMTDMHKDPRTDSAEPGREILKTRSQGQAALQELSGILGKMGIKAQVFFQEKDDRIYLEIHGNNLGLVIGKHGQTLDALEFILNAVHRKNFQDPKHLILDAQGYREKKKSVLKKILFSARDAVVSTNNEVPLDPMSPADRKMIHILCRELTGVKSESRGEGNNRRVVITPTEIDEIDYDSVVN